MKTDTFIGMDVDRGRVTRRACPEPAKHVGRLLLNTDNSWSDISCLCSHPAFVGAMTYKAFPLDYVTNLQK